MNYKYIILSYLQSMYKFIYIRVLNSKISAIESDKSSLHSILNNERMRAAGIYTQYFI